MRLINSLMTLLLMWGLFGSCISEDHSDCTNQYIVNLSYMADGTREIFNEKIEKVQMFIFDNQQNILSQSELTGEETSYRRVLLPPLEQGDYRVVFIGNMFSTSVSGLDSGSYPEMFFAAESYLDGQVTSGNDSLYFASVDCRIEPYSDTRRQTFFKADFMSSHYDVSVEVVGVPLVAKSSDGHPTVMITGLSPVTDFNNLAGGSPVDYVLDATHDGVSTLKAECCIMRHLVHDNVYLKLIAADGSEIVSVNFKEFIEAHRDVIDCSKQEVLIPFSIKYKSVGVNVTVPDWIIHDIVPEF